MTTKNIKKFNLVPSTRIMFNISQTGAKPYQAVAELIDNSIDAGATKIEINYTVDKEHLTSLSISDNGAGMCINALVNGLSLARSDKSGEGTIGHYGMGMKTALVSLGRAWSIQTSKGNNESFVVSQSIDEIINNQNWEVEVETIQAKKKLSSGTYIHVLNCQKINAALFEESLCEKLGETYRLFIKNNKVQITINGVELDAISYTVYEENFNKFQFDIDGKTVTGWIGILDKPIQDRHGFSLFKNGRVIIRNSIIGFPAGSDSARIVGEIHLDKFETDYHKTNFNRSNSDWHKLNKALIGIVTPVVKAAKEIIKSEIKIDPKVDKNISDSINKMVSNISKDNVLKFLFKLGKDNASDPKKISALKNKVDERIRSKASNTRVTSPRGGIKIQHNLVNSGSDQVRKAWEFNDGTLNVFINIDHPAFPESEHQEKYVLNSVIESLASFRVNDEASKNNCEASLDSYENILDKLYRLIPC